MHWHLKHCTALTSKLAARSLRNGRFHVTVSAGTTAKPEYVPRNLAS